MSDKLPYKDVLRMSDAFISDIEYLQEKLESLAEEERCSEMLVHGAYGCIDMFGVSEVLKRILKQNRMSNIYHPKGSMCKVCVNRDLECSEYLDFKFMPVMSQYSRANNEDIYKIVKCGMFNKLENKE